MGRASGKCGRGGPPGPSSETRYETKGGPQSPRSPVQHARTLPSKAGSNGPGGSRQDAATEAYSLTMSTSVVTDLIIAVTAFPAQFALLILFVRLFYARTNADYQSVRAGILPHAWMIELAAPFITGCIAASFSRNIWRVTLDYFVITAGFVTLLALIHPLIPPKTPRPRRGKILGWVTQARHAIGFLSRAVLVYTVRVLILR